MGLRQTGTARMTEVTLSLQLIGIETIVTARHCPDDREYGYRDVPGKGIR